MGYPFGKKGWYLFDLDSQKFFVSRVKFFEDVFPFLDPTSCNIIPKNVVPKNAEITLDLDDIYEHDFPLTTQFTPTSSQTQAASPSTQIHDDSPPSSSSLPHDTRAASPIQEESFRPNSSSCIDEPSPEECQPIGPACSSGPHASKTDQSVSSPPLGKGHR